MSKLHLSVCDIEEPSTGLETKFSLRHCAALTLAGKDTSAITTYSDAEANTPRLMQLRRKVCVNGCLPTGLDANVEIQTEDGHKYRASYDAGLPATSLEAQEEKLIKKFESLSKASLGERWRETCDKLLRFDRLKSLDRVLLDTVRHGAMA